MRCYCWLSYITLLTRMLLLAKLHYTFNKNMLQFGVRFDTFETDSLDEGGCR